MLHRHLYHRAEYKNACYLCGKHYRLFSTLFAHMNKRHFPQNTNKCEICDANLRAGEESAHSCIEPCKLRCEQCPMQFDKLSAFSDHLKAGHLQKRRYKCKVCKRVFGARILLDEHSPMHANSTFTCDICSKMFAKKVNLKQHMNETHVKRGKPSIARRI